MGRTFVTFFPYYRDHHFWKDPGQLPFRISAEGFEASVVRFRSEDTLKVTEKYVRVIEIRPLIGRKAGNISLLVWMMRHGRETDVLNLFHLSWQSLLASWIYKFFNRDGFVYIKMDNCHASGRYPWEDTLEAYARALPAGRRLREWLMRRLFVRTVDLWSVEDDESREYFECRYPVFRGRIITVYNGHCADILDHGGRRVFSGKENIILNAGRLGTQQKATEVLLEAFRIVAPRTDYTLHLAGTMETEFLQWYEKFLTANPGLENRIVYHGPLDPAALYDLYDRSRILCMPSRYEGLAIVYCEAMYFGNAVVTTRMVSPASLIAREGAGIIAESANAEDIARALLNLLADTSLVESSCRNAMNVADRYFSWPVISANLASEIEVRIKQKRKG